MKNKLLSKINRTHILILALLAFLLVIIIKSAWIVDDAYISFRYVRNFLDGYGLRWNVTERVQAYTNPLYVFLMAPLYALSKNMYLSSIFLSTALTIAAVLIGTAPFKKKNTWAFVLVIVALTTSKAFIDYATSGLENPMTFLITAMFYREFFRQEDPTQPRSFLKLCLIASLITINRLDAILLFIPPLCYAFFKQFQWKKIGMGFLGFSPFILWEIFSVIYYGFLFPNTAYAKLNLTTAKLEQLSRGIKYIFSSNIYGDNVTLIFLFVAIALGIFLWKQQSKRLTLAAGSVLLYLLYIVNIGGDFMVGRFLSGPFFLSVLIVYEAICLIPWRTVRQPQTFRRASAFIIAFLLFIGCIPQTSPITSPLRYQKYYDYLRSSNPIDRPRDVRSYYYDEVGLTYYLSGSLRDGYDPERAIHRWGIEAQSYNEEEVYVTGAMGFIGYFSPKETRLIDIYALSDPLLARIPAPPNQFAAHNQRGIPAGYVETMASGVNQIEDAALKEYYDHLHLIVSGDLFAPGRFKAIVDMNLGRHDHLIEVYTQSAEYRQSVQELGK